MNIAIIPARGGSKRIPRKNVRPFCGQPMIAWPIATAIESHLFDHVLVSTEDAEIAKIARQAGAEIPFVRPDELSDDHCGTTDVMIHALSWAVEAGWPVEAACCIYPTAAFISSDDLVETHQMLSLGCDFVFGAVRYGHPPQRGFLRAADGSPQPLEPNHQMTRTQDLPPVYHDAGQFYWGTYAAWMERRRFFSPGTHFIELPPWRAYDIDRSEDWEMAERLFAATRTSGE